MLMLRLENGLNFANFEKRLGSDARLIFAEMINRLAELKLLDISPTAARLTTAGLNVADAIAAEFL
jgi:coproporphyrinogen III oxidase-like Fe-S oxidoreductase